MRSFRCALVLIPLLAAALCAPKPAHAGADDGPYPVREIYSGIGDAFPNESHPPQLFSNGRQVFFKARDNAHGVQLWASDGTPQGTKMLTSAVNSETYADEGYAVDDKGRVYFTYNDQVHGYELWSTDGTVAGTRMVVDFNPGTGLGVSRIGGTFSFLNSRMHFLGGTDSKHFGLCSTDGTTQGTHLYANLVLNDGSSLYAAAIHGQYKDRLIATRIYLDSVSRNYVLQLWISDGASSGAVKLANLASSLNTPPTLDPQMVEFGGKLFLIVRAEKGFSFWRTDGTPAGTVCLRNLYYDRLSCLTRFRDRLYFVGGRAYGQTDKSWMLYSCDGTSESLAVAATLPYTANSYYIPSYISATDKFMLLASEESLWRTDGTSTGTLFLRSIVTSDPAQFIRLLGQNRWIFGNGGIWWTDGTKAGTQQIPWPDQFVSYPNPSGFVQLNDKLLYSAKDWRGRELWRLPVGPYLNPVRAWDAFR